MTLKEIFFRHGPGVRVRGSTPNTASFIVLAYHHFANVVDVKYDDGAVFLKKDNKGVLAEYKDDFIVVE